MMSTGIILGMGLAIERLRYNVTLSLFGWSHNQKDYSVDDNKNINNITITNIHISNVAYNQWSSEDNILFHRRQELHHLRTNCFMSNFNEARFLKIWYYGLTPPKCPQFSQAMSNSIHICESSVEMKRMPRLTIYKLKCFEKNIACIWILHYSSH